MYVCMYIISACPVVSQCVAFSSPTGSSLAVSPYKASSYDRFSKLAHDMIELKVKCLPAQSASSPEQVLLTRGITCIYCNCN